MPRTSRETIKALCKTIITRLENQKAILVSTQDRQQVFDEVYDFVHQIVLSDEDLHDRTIELIGDKKGSMDDVQFTESEQYRTARGIVKKKFGEDEFNGFYFQGTIKNIADRVCTYLMKSPFIEDVFHDDRDIVKNVVQTVKRFNPKNLV